MYTYYYSSSIFVSVRRVFVCAKNLLSFGKTLVCVVHASRRDTKLKRSERYGRWETKARYGWVASSWQRPPRKASLVIVCACGIVLLVLESINQMHESGEWIGHFLGQYGRDAPNPQFCYSTTPSRKKSACLFGGRVRCDPVVVYLYSLYSWSARSVRCVPS